MRRFVLTLCLVSVLLTAAGSLFAAGQQEDGKIEIGAILLDTKHEWFAEVIEGMKKAGTDLGVDVMIMSSDSDVAKEANLIDNFIAQQVDAISISPQSDQASVPAFERAVAADIPVITWNSKVDSPESKYFIGVDNYDLGAQTGEYAAQFIEEKMGGKANIAVIGTSKYSVGIDRVNGFKDKVAAAAGATIVAEQDAEYKELGLSVTESILEAHPEVDLIWCWNQGALLGSLAALNGKGETDIVLMGTDMSIDIARSMLEDNAFLYAVTTQQPFEIGYTSISNAVDVVKTGSTDNEVLIPLKTYTLDDAAEVQKYLDDRAYLIK